MWSHRMMGGGVALGGLALLLAQFGLADGSSVDDGAAADWLWRVSALVIVGGVALVAGVLLAAAPRATLRSWRRAARAVRGRPSP